MEEPPTAAPFVDPDGALVQEFLSSRPGDMRAFETLVKKYQKQLVANCRYLTAEPASADDLAQEVFVRVYFGLRRFEGRSSFRRWMQSIKVKHCLTYLRKERRQRFVGIEDDAVQLAPQLSAPPEVQRLIDEESNREMVGAILEQMPETLRVALILRDMDELPYEEIAEVLSINLSAAKMRIARGRKEFRERYREALEKQTRAVHA